MNDYEKLKDFWNNTLTSNEVYKVEKWIMDPFMNNIFKEYINDNTNVLDLGCGSGWLSFEISLNNPNCSITSIDTSENVIKNDTLISIENNIDNIDFICCEELSEEYYNKYDVCFSINVIDVLPNDIIEKVLFNIHNYVKKGGHIFIGINPDYPLELLTNMGFIEKDKYLYKNDILRCNIKDISEWVNIFNRYFKFIGVQTFSLTENEIKYPRRMFILENK